MKTLVCTQPGKWEYQDRPLPVPEPGKAIIKVRRIGICGTDLHAFEGTQPYFSYPRVLGHELSGELVSTDIPDFTPGDVVSVIPYFSCKQCVACRSGKPNCCVQINVFGVHSDGGMAEYISVPADALLHSNGLGFDELALVEPLAIGAHGIRRAGVKDGEFVLVIGAGPIGLGIMEFACIAGGRVISMDLNQERLDFCQRQLGVEHVVNARSADTHEQIAALTEGDMPSVVVDATGHLGAINNAFRYMAHGGRYVLVGLQKGEISFSHPEFHKREATLMSSRNATREDFEHVVNAIRQGWIDPKTYITHRAPFEEVKDQFAGWLDPGNGVIKAMVELP